MNVSVREVASNLKREFLYSLPVLHPRKICFDHLPKCGGGTLNAYLRAHYPNRKIYSTNGLNLADYAKSVKRFKDWPKQKRHSYGLIKGHFANELFDYVNPECLKVTVLRDPVERIISHYFYVKRNPTHYLYSSVHDAEMSLEDYASSNLSPELRNWYTTHFSGLPVDIAEENPEESVAKAAEALLERYDIIGFLDSFSLFIEKLREQANLRYEYKDIRRNVSKNKSSAENLPQSTIHRIEQVNHLDIVLYRRIREQIS